MSEEGMSQEDIDAALLANGGMPKKTHAGGRPTDYDPKYVEEIEEFFDVEPWYESPVTMTFKDGSTKEWMERKPNPPPFVSAFARKIGVTKQTIYNWANAKNEDGTLKHPEFFDALMRAKGLRKEILVQNGLMNLYNPVFTMFTCKNYLGWKDKTEVEQSNPTQNEILKKAISLGGMKIELS